MEATTCPANGKRPPGAAGFASSSRGPSLEKDAFPGSRVMDLLRHLHDVVPATLAVPRDHPDLGRRLGVPGVLHHVGERLALDGTSIAITVAFPLHGGHDIGPFAQQDRVD